MLSILLSEARSRHNIAQRTDSSVEFPSADPQRVDSRVRPCGGRGIGQPHAANVNARSKLGARPLLIAAAAYNGAIEAARLLIEKGADVDGAAGNGDRNAAVVKLLIEHGAAINARSGDTLEVVKNGAPSGLGHVTRCG